MYFIKRLEIQFWAGCNVLIFWKSSVFCKNLIKTERGSILNGIFPCQRKRLKLRWRNTTLPLAGSQKWKRSIMYLNKVIGIMKSNLNLNILPMNAFLENCSELVYHSCIHNIFSNGILKYLVLYFIVYKWQWWDSNPCRVKDWCLKPAPWTARPHYLFFYGLSGTQS